MNFKVLGVSVAAIMFVAGLAAANPQAIAANPVLEQVLAIVTGTQTDVSSIKQQIEDPETGLVEIKNEIRNIETDIDSIDQRLAAIEAALNVEPPACVEDSDCDLPNAVAVCELGQCEIDSCDEGWVDVNQNPVDGCEEFFSPPGPGTGTCTTEELTILANCGATCEGDQICIQGCFSDPRISSECRQAAFLLGVCAVNTGDNTCIDAIFTLTPNQCIVDNCSSEWEAVFGEAPVLPGICEGEPANTPLPANSQTDGDCQVLVCDGNGNVISVNDDADFADDGNECTFEFCQNGNLVINNAPQDTPCGAGGVCDGNGQCSILCAPNEILCDQVCVDPTSNSSHCGGCGILCSPDEICADGQCQPALP